MVAVLASAAHLTPDDPSSSPPRTPSPATPPNTPSPATHNHQQTTCKVSVTVPRDAVGFIIGKRGETVRNMMNRSRAFIQVDRDDTNPHAPHRIFHIQGDPAAVAAARALIKEKVYAVLHGKPHAHVRDALVQTHSQPGASHIPQLDEDDDDTRFDPPLEMWIPRGCVGMIIGHGGQVINEMQEKAGATIVVHNNQMDRHGAKLLTISGGHAEKLQAKHLIQNILDRAGSRFRYMEHPHDAPHFFPPQPAHPHPHAPPWPYPQNTAHIPFDPRQPVPDFVGIHPLSPWMQPLPIPAQSVRPIIQQHPNPQTPQQHMHHHIQQQVLHHQSPSQTFPAPQPRHQFQQQQIQQPSPQKLPQQKPQQPMDHTAEHPREQQSDRGLQHPAKDHSTVAQQVESQPQHRQQQVQSAQQIVQPQPQLVQPQPQLVQPQPQLVQPHPQLIQPQPQPQLQLPPQPNQSLLDSQTAQQTALQQQQRLQALQAQHQQTRHVQPGVFPSLQMSSHVNPVFGQNMPPTPTPIPWNPAHVPYPVPPPLGVHGNSMVPNHPMYNMNTKPVYVPSSCVGIVIGRCGETIRDLQQRSGAYIKVTPDRDANSGDPERLIYITGTPEALELAHSLVNDVINEGLSRNYRDGVEPKASIDAQDLKSESGGSRQKEDQPESGSISGKPSKPETSFLNGKSDQDVTSNSKGEETLSESADPQNGNSLREASEAQDDLQDKKSKPRSPEPGTSVSTATSTAEKHSGRDKPKGWSAGQADDEADVEADSHPNAFAGEGRLVQRPATDYPSASISFEMKIPHAKVGVIIGKKGQTIRQLQQKSGARIVVSKKIDTSREDNPRAVTITGPQPFVEAARRLIVDTINPPADQKGEDGEAALNPLDFDEGPVGDDPGIEALAAELSNQSLTSPLPPIIPGSPTPISPMRVPQTPPFTTFQRPLPFVGSNTPGQFGTVPPPYRPIMRNERSDFRGHDSPLQQPTQFQAQMAYPGQFAKKVQIPPAFPYEQTADTESMHPTFDDYRQAQFFPHGGVNYAGLPGEGVQSFVQDVAGSVGPAYSPTTPQGYEEEEEEPQRSNQEHAPADQSQRQEAQS